MRSLDQFKTYKLKFHGLVGTAREKRKISSRDVNRYFWEGLNESFRSRVEARMLVTNPDLDVSVPFTIKAITEGADYILNPNRFDQHLTTRKGYQSSDSDSEREAPVKPKKTPRYSSDESDDEPKPLTQHKLPLTPPKTPPRSPPKPKKRKLKDEEDFDQMIQDMSKLNVTEPAYFVKYVQLVRQYPQLKEVVEPPVRRNQGRPNEVRQPFRRDLPPHQQFNAPRQPFNPPPRQPLPQPPFNPPPQQPFKTPPQQSFSVATGPNAIRQDYVCFGCGKNGHHIRQCADLDKLINKGQAIRDPVTGLLQWPDGSRIYRSGNETWAEAITRNAPAAVHFVEVMAYEPNLDTACNYIGVDREEDDASTEEQEEELGWTSGEVGNFQAFGAKRTENVSKEYRKKVQADPLGGTQGMKKLPRNREIKRASRPDPPIQDNLNFDSNEARISLRPTSGNPNQDIVEGKTNNQLLPKEVNKKIPAKLANNTRKDSAHQEQPSVPIVTNPRSKRKGNDCSVVIKKILKTPITLTMQEVVDTAPSLRRDLVSAMKQAREDSSPIQEKTGFLGEVAEEIDQPPCEPSDQDESAQEPNTDTDGETDFNDRAAAIPPGTVPRDGLIKIPVRVEGTMMTGIFDSGSQINIISQKLVDDAGIPWSRTPKYQIPLVSVDGNVTRCAGMIPKAKLVMKTEKGKVVTTGNLYVKRDTGFQLLLGREWGVDNKANWIEDGNKSHILIRTNKGNRRIKPLPTLRRVVEDEEEERQFWSGEADNGRARIYAAERIEEGEVPDSENEEEEAEVENNEANSDAESREERKNDLWNLPMMIGDEDPPTPAQRREEFVFDEDDRVEEDRSEDGKDFGEAEERARRGKGKSNLGSNGVLSEAETECTIDSELHETYIKMVQQGISNEEWNAFRKLEERESNRERKKWQELCTESPDREESIGMEDLDPERARKPTPHDSTSPPPSQTLQTLDLDPEPPSRPTRKRKKDLENGGKPEVTKVTRSKRKRRMTERAKGSEYQKYLRSYQRKETRERKVARGYGAAMVAEIHAFAAEVVPENEERSRRKQDKVGDGSCRREQWSDKDENDEEEAGKLTLPIAFDEGNTADEGGGLDNQGTDREGPDDPRPNVESPGKAVIGGDIRSGWKLATGGMDKENEDNKEGPTHRCSSTMETTSNQKNDHGGGSIDPTDENRVSVPEMEVEEWKLASEITEEGNPQHTNEPGTNQEPSGGISWPLHATQIHDANGVTITEQDSYGVKGETYESTITNKMEKSRKNVLSSGKDEACESIITEGKTEAEEEKLDLDVSRLKLIKEEATNIPDHPKQEGVGPEASCDIGIEGDVPQDKKEPSSENREVPDPASKEWNDGQTGPDPGVNQRVPPELEVDLLSEYPGAFSYDPYEGMEMLGIRRVPDPRAPPHGVLASREVTLFADDHIRNERHFYARCRVRGLWASI